MRLLAYNALIIGRCKVVKNAVKDSDRNLNRMLGERKWGIKGSVNASDLSDKLNTATPHNGADVDAVANANTNASNDSNVREQNVPSQRTLSTSALTSPVNLDEEPPEERMRILNKDLIDSLPTSQIYKVDLTGNFYQCQGAAVGGMAPKIETWMRSKGAFFACVEGKSEGKETLIPAKEAVVSTGGNSVRTENKSIYVDDDSNSNSNFEENNGDSSCPSYSHGTLGGNEINGTNSVDDVTNLEINGTNSVDDVTHLKINGTNLVDDATHLDDNGQEAGRVGDKLEVDEDQKEDSHIEQEEGDDDDDDEELTSGELLSGRTEDDMTPHVAAVIDSLSMRGRGEEMQSDRIRQEVGTYIDRHPGGTATDTNSNSNSNSNSDMRQCLDIAQCCLDDVYGPSSLSNYTIQIATVQGVSLWG